MSKNRQFYFYFYHFLGSKIALQMASASIGLDDVASSSDDLMDEISPHFSTASLHAVVHLSFGSFGVKFFREQYCNYKSEN